MYILYMYFVNKRIEIFIKDNRTRIGKSKDAQNE